MTERPTHAQVRAHMLELFRGNGIRPPDEIVDVTGPDEVLFLFDDPRVAVVVALDDVPSGDEVLRAFPAAA
jgi:hypothetical protein